MAFQFWYIFVILLFQCNERTWGFFTRRLPKNTYPKICKGIECPEFRTLKYVDFHLNFEQREYEPVKFVSVKSSSCQYNTAMADGQIKLLQYRDGKNSFYQKFTQTIPTVSLITVKINQNESDERSFDSCNNKFTLMFSIPKNMQQNPPLPLDPQVEIIERPTVIVYVHKFGGNIETRLDFQFKIFKYALDKSNICYDRNKFYTAVYDSGKTSRRNEIWVEDCLKPKSRIFG